MNLLYIQLFFIIHVTCYFIVLKFSVRRNIAYIVMETMAFFFCEYISVSIFYLLINHFQIIYVLSTIFLANLMILFLFRKNDVYGVRKNKEDYVILILLLILLVFSKEKSEDIRTNSDMGIYVQRAITLMSEDTGCFRRINEIGTISSKVDEGILVIQDQLQGLYRYDSQKYEYHGLPTFPAFLALFGKMFGMYKWTYALDYLFTIVILCFFYACKKIGKIEEAKYIPITFFCFAPLYLYISKVTLSENLFVAALGIAILKAALEKNKVNIIYCSIALGLLGFMHISMFIYFPMIFLTLFIFNVLDKNNYWGYINIIQSVLYIVSLFFACKETYIYTNNQFALLGRIFGIKENPAIPISIILAVGVLFLIGLQIVTIYKKYIKNNINKLYKTINFKIILAVWILIIAAGSCINGYMLGYSDKFIEGGGTWHLRSVYANNGIISLLHLNIVTIFMATCYITIPIIIIHLFRIREDNSYLNIIMILWLYSISIYIFVSIDTPNHYYSARYFCNMIMPITIILCSLLIKSKKLLFVMLAFSIAISLPFNIVLKKNSAFYGEFEILQETLETIPEKSLVFVREEDALTNTILVNSLREINNNLVYNLKDKEEVLKEFDGVAYVITTENIDKNRNDIKLDKTFQHFGNIGSLEGYPLSVSKSDVHLAIYQIKN